MSGPYSSPPTPLPGDPICVNVWFSASSREDRSRIAKCCRDAAGAHEASTHITPGPPWNMDMQFRCDGVTQATELLDRILRACPEVSGEVVK